MIWWVPLKTLLLTTPGYGRNKWESMLRFYQQNQLTNAPRRSSYGYGFTLVELLVVIAVIAILASLLMSALTRTKMRAQGTFCLNNTRQLTLAWKTYSDDRDDRLPYNLAMNGEGSSQPVSSKTNLNWVNDIMDWEVHLDNIDSTGITDASLWPYARSLGIYHCPADNVVSSVQAAAGWSSRIRSYSMNAMVGDAGAVSDGGRNKNNPDYVQFFTMSAISHPANIFIFLDEHPDSINDGYFLNKAVDINYASSYAGKSSVAQWIDLPASFHNGGASFSFADGHSESHRWKLDSTKLPPMPDAAGLPRSLSSSDITDFNWVVDHMSVDTDSNQK